jgi:hypothetical protein
MGKVKNLWYFLNDFTEKQVPIVDDVSDDIGFDPLDISIALKLSKKTFTWQTSDSQPECREILE